MARNESHANLELAARADMQSIARARLAPSSISSSEQARRARMAAMGRSPIRRLFAWITR